MLHDYHLYTAPEAHPRRAHPDAFLHFFVHIPWSQPDYWRILPPAHPRGDPARPAGQRHHRLPHPRATRATSCSAARTSWTCEVDYERLPGALGGPGRLGALLPDLGERADVRGARPTRPRWPRRRGRSCAAAASTWWCAWTAPTSRRTRCAGSRRSTSSSTATPSSTRTSPSSRSSSPRARTWTSTSSTSRKIRDVVSHINTKHGNTDWMPIDLRIESNIHRAVAAYKHYDVLVVNPIFDGMNLIAKEAPLVNERDGVMILSENAGAHEELGLVRDLDQPVRRRRPGRGPPPRPRDARRRAGRSASGRSSGSCARTTSASGCRPSRPTSRKQAHGRPPPAPSAPGRDDEPRPTHLDERGQARMVGVGHKPAVGRRAVAEAVVRMAPGERPGDVRGGAARRATRRPSRASRGSWPPSGRPSWSRCATRCRSTGPASTSRSTRARAR